MEILEEVLQCLRGVCGAFRDRRKGNRVIENAYTMADIVLSAFSLFYSKVQRGGVALVGGL